MLSAANGVNVMLAMGDEYTPTPAISHAIVTDNQGRSSELGFWLADGIVITPSHNPPDNGDFKYNRPTAARQAPTSPPTSPPTLRPLRTGISKRG